MTKAKELKDLVPSFKLCRQIPKRYFKNSALVWEGQGTAVWRRSSRTYELQRKCGTPMYPAPTLAEILDKLENFPKFYTTLYCGSDYHGPKWYTVVLYKLYKETPPHKWIKTSEGVGKSATNAALEVWLMFNKKPEKNNG